MNGIEHLRRVSLCVAVVSVLAVAGCDPQPLPAPPASPAASGSAMANVDPSNTPQPMGSGSASPAVPSDINLRKPVLRGKTGDGRSWELESNSIRYDDRHKVARADGIKCTFYDDKSRKTKLVLTSDAADVDLTSQALAFRGKVTARASTGEKLEIGHLRWDGKKKKFFGNENVRLTKGESSMTGDRLIADQSMQTVEIKGNVRIYLKNLDDLKVGARSKPAVAPDTAH